MLSIRIVSDVDGACRLGCSWGGGGRGLFAVIGFGGWRGNWGRLRWVVGVEGWRSRWICRELVLELEVELLVDVQEEEEERGEMVVVEEGEEVAGPLALALVLQLGPLTGCHTGEW